MLAGEVPAGTRRWGDGGSDRRAHVIEDISYAGAYIVCRCGDVLIDSRWTGDGRLFGYLDASGSPTKIANGTEWARHGGKQSRSTGDRTRINEPAPAHERFEAILTEFARQRGRCTCTPGSDITLCPNYQPGDEEVDDE